MKAIRRKVKSKTKRRKVKMKTREEEKESGRPKERVK